MAETVSQGEECGSYYGDELYIYAIGMLGYWVCGFALQMEASGGAAALGGGGALNGEFVIHLFGRIRLFGTKGFFLSGVTYDAVIFSIFLFQNGIHGYHRYYTDGPQWLNAGHSSPSYFTGSLFRLSSIQSTQTGYGAAAGYLNWGKNFGLGHGVVDFAGSSVVHLTGGVSALAGAIVLGPRLGKYKADGTSNAITGAPHTDGYGRVLYTRFRLVRI